MAPCPSAGSTAKERLVRINSILVLAFGLLVGIDAVACGPFFPLRLFAERDMTFASLPAVVFSLEGLGVTKALPDPAWKPGESVSMQGSSDARHPLSILDWETAHLSPAQHTAVMANRSGRASAAQRALLPAIVLAYTDGALAFGNSDKAAAARAFTRAAEIRDAAFGAYRIFARYMQGRTLTDTAQATAAFAQLREEVRKGAPDPLGLGLASLGEEAGRYWNDRRDVPRAVRLYVQQALGGDANGTASLRLVMPAITAALTGSPEQNRAARSWLKDPLLRGAYISYLASRGESLYENWHYDEKARYPAPVLQALADVVAAADPRTTVGASRLAAIAWRTGHYDWAARWSQRGDDALAWWVRAKLARRRGDSDAAKADYEKALARLAAPKGASSLLDNGHQCYLEAERAMLALDDGRLHAAAELMKGRDIRHQLYWLDIAYLAERLLTLEELGQFVREAKPAATPAPTVYGYLPPAENYQRLQELYARRLLREGQGRKAETLFVDAAHRQAAQAYNAALKRALDKALPKAQRARAWFEAGRIARQQGMEILGYEVEPDYAVYDGWQSMGIPAKASLKMKPAEAARWDANRPLHDVRFHYRSLAADYAEQAARLLPPHSQPYAAVLCFASAWTMRTETKRAQRLGYRVIRSGVTLAEPAQGEPCAEPDFGKKR